MKKNFFKITVVILMICLVFLLTQNVSLAASISKKDVVDNLLEQSHMKELKDDDFSLIVSSTANSNEADVYFSKNEMTVFKCTLVFGNDYVAIGVDEEVNNGANDESYKMTVMQSVAEYFTRISENYVGLSESEIIANGNRAVERVSNSSNPNNNLIYVVPSELGINMVLVGQNGNDPYTTKVRALMQEIINDTPNQDNTNTSNTVNNTSSNNSTQNTVNNKANQTSNNVKTVNNSMNATSSNSTAYKGNQIPRAGLDIGFIKICSYIIATAILIMVVYTIKNNIKGKR